MRIYRKKRCHSAIILLMILILLSLTGCGKAKDVVADATVPETVSTTVGTEPINEMQEIDPTEPYIIKRIDRILPYCSTKYDTLKDAEAAVGLHLELPEMDQSLIPLYYTSGNMLRVHFVHFTEGFTRSEDGTLLREVDENIMLVKAPKEDWERYAGSNRFSEEKTVYVYDYPVIIQFQDNRIIQAFWQTGNIGYIIVFDSSSNRFGVADVIKMAKIICEEDYTLLTEQLRDTDASTEARSVEALQEAWYPTLAQAEKAIGFEIQLPEMDDRFVPEYFTDADYVSVYDSEGNICEAQSVYWVTARFTQYVHYEDEKYFLRTPEKEVTFLKSTDLDAESCHFLSAAGIYIYMRDEPEQKTTVLQGIPVILGIEDGKIVQARWSKEGFGYCIHVSGGELQKEDILRVMECMCANRN